MSALETLTLFHVLRGGGGGGGEDSLITIFVDSALEVSVCDPFGNAKFSQILSKLKQKPNVWAKIGHLKHNAHARTSVHTFIR